MASTNPARGMRDFLPADVRKRNYVINIIKEVYESYGFEPLETPAIENLETLTGKYGEEGGQLMFKILKRGEKLDLENASRESDLSDLALRYDLTVPLARVVANKKNELPKFFKRYQIQPVWRADRPARGRFREFYQCDVDAIGSASLVVEAELISAVCVILVRLGFSDFSIRINHRGILEDLLLASGLDVKEHTTALTALDKLDKIGREGVEREFKERGIDALAGASLLQFLESLAVTNLARPIGKTTTKALIQLQKKLADAETNAHRDLEEYNELVERYETLKNAPRENIDQSGDAKVQHIQNRLEHQKQLISELRNLRRLLTIAEFIDDRGGKLGVGFTSLQTLIQLPTNGTVAAHLELDFSLVRGLSYYTGAIMEINVPDLGGSLGGGGRYDGLIGMFGKEQIPACGFSLGLERILVVMEERGMFPAEIAASTPADVMVTILSDETASESLKLAGELRKQGLRVTVYPEADKFGKQMKYADTIGVPYVCILGESEIADGQVTVRNMLTREQQTIERAKASELLPL